MKIENSLFNCPCCGNELGVSDKDVITCKWCQSKIVPKGRRKKREEEFISMKGRY